jgi:hypothetical protein
MRRDPPRLVAGERLGRRAPPRLFLEVDVGQLLAIHRSTRAAGSGERSRHNKMNDSAAVIPIKKLAKAAITISRTAIS